MPFKEDKTSFAVGHMALAYLIAKPISRKLKTSLNIPLILVLSIIPDIDIFYGTNGMHRGPTHSIITALLIFIPAFAIYRKKALPYLLALASHAAIADFLIGGQLTLLWPLTTRKFGLPELGIDIGITNPINVALEWALFATATLAIYKTGDLTTFLRNKKTNLLLAIPIGTVLLPTLVSYPLQVPIALIPPHLFYLALFSISFLIVLAGLLKKI